MSLVGNIEIVELLKSVITTKYEWKWSVNLAKCKGTIYIWSVFTQGNAECTCGGSEELILSIHSGLKYLRKEDLTPQTKTSIWNDVCMMYIYCPKGRPS